VICLSFVLGSVLMAAGPPLVGEARSIYRHLT
jgi:hypothetical protein